MSRVIKNDDGVVVVEGTPAATLVKESDKFFASKPPERMAGESISQPKKIPETEVKLVSRDISAFRAPVMEEQEPSPQEMTSAPDPDIQEKTPEEKEIKREEAVEKTKEFKRQRFAERSEEEQEATKGRFITTLGR